MDDRTLNPELLPALPGQKALTFLMMPDDGEAQADAAIAAMKEGRTIFLPTPISSLFFHHLRLRVALDETLIDKIAVYYLTPQREWREVGLRQKEAHLWPVGFEHELWRKETEIIAVCADPATASDGAKEIAAAVRRKYGC